MKTNFFPLLFAIIASVGTLSAEGIKIGELYYILDILNMTAKVVKTPNEYQEGVIALGASDYSGDIIIPSHVIYEENTYEVIGIKFGAFGGCLQLHSLKIPQTVCSIEKFAIIGNPSLDTIIVDARNPKYDSRDRCNSIIETSTNTLICGSNGTIIPKSISTIGSWSFIWQTFEYLNIPEGVKLIEDHTLQRLPNIKSITFPNSLESIDEDVLVDCPSLKSVTIGPNVIYTTDMFLSDALSLEEVTCLAITPPDCWTSAFTNIPEEAILYVPKESIELYKFVYVSSILCFLISSFMFSNI